MWFFKYNPTDTDENQVVIEKEKENPILALIKKRSELGL